jgi:hypothetical protein
MCVFSHVGVVVIVRTWRRSRAMARWLGCCARGPRSEEGRDGNDDGDDDDDDDDDDGS